MDITAAPFDELMGMLLTERAQEARDELRRRNTLLVTQAGTISNQADRIDSLERTVSQLRCVALLRHLAARQRPSCTHDYLRHRHLYSMR